MIGCPSTSWKATELTCTLLKTGTEEEEALKSKRNFRSQSVVTQNPEAELMLEGDDDAVSLLQEKEIDNLAGKRHTHTHTLYCTLW